MSRGNKEKTKELILDTAIKLFITKGFLNTSTLDVAKAADIAHGTVFFHFPKRSDLIIEAIYKEMNKLAVDLNDASRNTDDVEKLCKIFIDEIVRYKEFYSVLIRDLPNLPIDVQRMVFASLSAFSVHFVDVIELGQGNSTLRKFEPKFAMFYWFGVINYIFTYEKLLGTSQFLKSDKKEIIDFFMASLKNMGYSTI